ncbi:unnamed protein product [Dracunculus medinensis]|uniref:F-box protein n=1 Tax=Dracunculus medinensis TaxID=318479 RepID=A0A0N4UAU3_DRAME|nr:unnamed protein product [Dracunculus medinensis]
MRQIRSTMQSLERLNANQLMPIECNMAIADNHEPLQCNSSIMPSGDLNDDSGTENENSLEQFSQKDERYLMPNKSQVLFYLSDASQLRIRRTGMEFQAFLPFCYSIDFPLFDIWFEPDCSKSNWVLESYGKTVLLISENIGYGCFFWKKPEPPIIELTDWNGDLFGYFVPGDPFLLEDSDKKTIAKLIAVEKNERNTVWICILEGSGREVARLEDFMTINFVKEAGGFQIKLLTLAAFARIVASQSPPSRSCFCSFLFSLFQC